MVLGGVGGLTAESLPLPLKSSAVASTQGAISDIPDAGFDLDAYLGSIEQDILQKALEKTGGVRKKAAELLGISFRSIRYRLAKFGISPDDEEV